MPLVQAVSHVTEMCEKSSGIANDLWNAACEGVYPLFAYSTCWSLDEIFKFHKFVRLHRREAQPQPRSFEPSRPENKYRATLGYRP